MWLSGLEARRKPDQCFFITLLRSFNEEGRGGWNSAALAANSMGNRTEQLAQSLVKVSDGCSQCNLTRRKSRYSYLCCLAKKKEHLQVLIN